MKDVSFIGSDSIFAKRLLSIMKETKTTQDKLSSNVGVTRQAISQYCDGGTMPNIEKLYLIAKYFNVSSDYFLGITTEKTLDTHIQSIHEYTGLSEKAVTNLSYCKDDEDLKHRIDMVNTILDDSELNNSLLDVIFDYVLGDAKISSDYLEYTSRNRGRAFHNENLHDRLLIEIQRLFIKLRKKHKPDTE